MDHATCIYRETCAWRIATCSGRDRTGYQKQKQVSDRQRRQCGALTKCWHRDVSWVPVSKDGAWAWVRTYRTIKGIQLVGVGTSMSTIMKSRAWGGIVSFL